MQSEAKGNGAGYSDMMGPLSFLLSQCWWMLALRGVFALIFGILALIWPGVTLLSLVLVFAAYRLVDGIFGLFAAFRAMPRNQGFVSLLLLSLADIAIGILAFLWPDITILAFVLLIAAWAIVSGIWMLAMAFRMDRIRGRGWLGFGGLASLIFGGFLVFAPLAGALVLTWWVGAYALIVGFALLVLAFQLRPKGDVSPKTPRPA